VAFGRIGAVTVLATIAARHAKNEVASPGGLLRRMVSLHFEGSLRLDRTLFGLVDGYGMRRQ
jgi:replication initiation protein RepC